MLLTGRNKQYFGVLPPAGTVTSKCGPSQHDTSRIYFLPSTMCADVPVIAPERMRCSSALYYLTPLTFAMYLSTFRWPFASILKGERLQVRGIWLTKVHVVTRQKTNFTSLDKSRVSEIHTALFYCPLFGAFFALTPLASLYHFLICVLLFSV